MWPREVEGGGGAGWLRLPGGAGWLGLKSARPEQRVASSDKRRTHDHSEGPRSWVRCHRAATSLYGGEMNEVLRFLSAATVERVDAEAEAEKTWELAHDVAVEAESWAEYAPRMDIPTMPSFAKAIGADDNQHSLGADGMGLDGMELDFTPL